MSASGPSAPAAVRWITRTLEGGGFPTWAVGGAVRDVLLGLPAGDWDLATRARPDDVRRLFRRTVPLGVEHGTVGVLSDDGTLFEVTTFRRDVETDGRHAVVAFADHLEEDLARRDFTVNAIAWHPIREEFCDPFHGREDLEARLLRSVGTPAERFAEDWLRVLRAIRFAGRFDMRIAPDTWEALCGAVKHLTSLSAERVREELVKVLDADRVPSTALELYRSSGALAVLYPELAGLAREEPRWSHVLRTLDALPCGRPHLRLAALLRPLADREAAQILLRLRLSNAQVNEAARRAAAPPLPSRDAPAATFRRWLSAVSPERLAAVARLDLAAALAAGSARLGAGSSTGAGEDARGVEEVVASWRRAREIRATRPPLSVSDLAVDGRDLMRLGLRPGPRFGTILAELLEWVLEDPARNTPEALEARVRASSERSGDGDRG